MSLRKFESPLPHFETRSSSGFQSLKNKCAKNAPMGNSNYKGLKIVKGARWYVEYYYRVPEQLREKHGGTEWKRFREYGYVNKYEGDEREKQCRILMDRIYLTLTQENFNPFEAHENLFIKKIGKSLTVIDALDYFSENIGEKGVEKETVARYKYTAGLLKDYLISKGLKDIEPDEIDESIVLDCLQFYKTSIPWGNRNYNNQLGYMSIIFNYLIRRKKINSNPAAHIPKLKHVTHKHRYYDEKTLKRVIEEIKKNEPYLYLAAQFVYYAGVRSAKELVGLQVKDILMDRDRIRFKGSETKGKRDDYIFLDPKLKEIIMQSGIMDYPGDHYIFTYHDKPHENQSADDSIQKKFRKIRKALKLGEDYTLYSFKHTRAIHLLMDGAEPVDIMQLFRHTDLGATTKYIRDLGFALGVKFANKSRDL